MEDCLRDFGTNNLTYDYNSQSPVATFTGNDENIFSLRLYYPEYLVYMLAENYKRQIKSLDAQSVWALLEHDRKINLDVSQHFNAENPLHQKLAAIAMQIEKQTKGSLFKGIS